jgi:hypothetical protein
MNLDNPHLLAAELRARACLLDGEEQADLLFLADEYDRMGDTIGQSPVKVCLPK